MGKQQKDKKTRAIRNIFYAVRMMWGMNKGIVIHSAFTNAVEYFGWVFYSLFFIRYIIGAIERKEPFTQIILFVLLSGIVYLVLAAYSSYIAGTFYPLAGADLYHKLYRRLYKKAGNVEIKCYEDSCFYNQYMLAIDRADEKLFSIIRNLFGILFGSISAATVFTTIYTIDNIAVLFVFFPIIGNFVFGYIHNKILYQRDKALVPYKRRIGYVNRVMYLSDFSKEMRLSNVYSLMKQKYINAVNGIFDTVERYAFKINLPLWLRNYFSFTMIFEGVLLYGAYRTIVSQSMRLSELAVLSSAMVSASWILIGFTDHILESVKQGMFMENLRTFLEYESKLPEDYDGILPEKDIESIEFRNVSFAYKQDIDKTIKNLSFKIEGKTNLALVGHNGAGKTTIIKLLFRLYDPTEGEILVNGRNIKEYNLKAYRGLFAAAFQDYKIFAFSIKENVMMRKTTTKDDCSVYEALKKAGVYDKVMTLPQKADTILTKEFDEEGALLSGGEYQKIVVARAFVKDVPMKVFDEPSSALDPIAEYELYENILKDSVGKTVIFISHRLSSVRNADRILMLESGQIVEQGTHEELMRENGHYADMYKKQAQNYLAVEDLKEVGAG